VNTPCVQLGYAKPSLFTLEDYRWAVSAVMTRQNRVPLGGTAVAPQFGLALIPLWDMINHANGTLTSTHDFEGKATECAAMQDFSVGDQIVMFYGPRTNSELLLHSGFVMEENPHDIITVKLGVGKGDALGSLKSKLLEALTIPTAGDFVVDRNGQLDPQLNAFIRINSMSQAELEHHLANPNACATLGDPDGAASEENEQKACFFFETR
jgi:histone-lysine N-methyltransferase SETD3